MTSVTDAPAAPRLGAAWAAAHAPAAGVSRWARMAALTIPFTVLPSSVWRIAVCTFHAPIARSDLLTSTTASGLPGVPLAAYVVGLSVASELLAFTAVGLVSTWGGGPVPGRAARPGGHLAAAAAHAGWLGSGGGQVVAAKLTGRESEVLRLIARGLSNAEIAGELFLGVETVKTHVGNVLAKLGARDRVQAVIAAYESGFIR
jgi:DNA-binding CsgD family transcriptional regulator